MSESFCRSSSGSGVGNADFDAYRRTITKRKEDKYIEGLKQRIEKLESAMSRLENTVKEITK